MAKLNTNSNSYIIAYAAIMVIVVAFLLAFVSSALQETQDKNVRNDVKKQILTALHIQTEDVDATYEKTVKDNLWDGTKLTEVAAEDFQTDYSPEIKAGRFHVFVANGDGKTKYVVPVCGMGLWGNIWGYIALDEDRQTVYGAYFNHQSETAGLGGEIKDSKAWQAKFQGKKAFADGKVALGVKKNVENPASEVDGITGATLTSNGVDLMLHEGLANYLSFINAK